MEKLDKKRDGVYVIEEEKTIANSKWEGFLDHDNVNHESITIYTGPKFTGEKVENYFISTPSETPWKTYLKVFSESEKIYITYETSGDQVEAEDINMLQDGLAEEIKRATEEDNTLNNKLNSEIARATDRENNIEDKLDSEITRATNKENELDSKIDDETERAISKENSIETNLNDYKASNNAEISLLKDRASSLEENKAEKTYVDIELLKKADKANTYTKDETDDRIQAIIGSAPDALDTLSEIAKALNDDPNFAATVTNLLAQKVDKVDGKGLSTEDFTTDEKQKLAGIEEEANKYIHPSTHPASMIIENSEKRFVSDDEKAAWNDANNKKHTHSNKSIIDTITQTLIDEWNAKETSTGAQEKANIAEQNAKAYADSIKPTKISELENDKQFITQEELGNAGYGDMLKSVYDTDNDGKIDMAEVADKVPWSGITDKPSTFTPSDHNHDERYIKNTGGTIQNGDLFMDGGSVNYVRPDTTSGWARGFWWSKRDLTRIGGIGVLGSGETISKFYIGYGISPWQNSIVEIYSDSVNINGTIKQQGKEVWHKGKPLTWNDLKGV